MSYRLHRQRSWHYDQNITSVQQTSPVQSTGSSSSPKSPKLLAENKKPPVQTSSLQSISAEDLHQLTLPMTKNKEYWTQITWPISNTSSSSPQSSQQIPEYTVKIVLKESGLKVNNPNKPEVQIQDILRTSSNIT